MRIRIYHSVHFIEFLKNDIKPSNMKEEEKEVSEGSDA